MSKRFVLTYLEHYTNHTGQGKSLNVGIQPFPARITAQLLKAPARSCPPGFADWRTGLAVAGGLDAEEKRCSLPPELLPINRQNIST